MPPRPHAVQWTQHALERAESASFVRGDVEDALLDGHDHRRANTGAADWLLVTDAFAIAYNHPDGGDESTARVVTVYRP